VRRIFRLYADGMSTRGIANLLNREKVLPPGRRWRNRSKLACQLWSYTAIAGHRRKGSGILNNDAYLGRIVWNRCEWVLDPDTETRHPLQRPEKEWLVKEAPELRIIDDALWRRVKALQVKRRPDASTRERQAASIKNRYLLSGLLVCGCCGAPLVRTGASGYACSTRRNRGNDTCGFKGTPNRQALEAKVLEAWRTRLFCEENMEVVIRAMRAGIKRKAADAKESARGDAQAVRLRQVNAEIKNVMGAIRAGGGNDAASLLRKELDRLVAERSQLAAMVSRDGGPDERTIEVLLAHVPQIVAEYFANGDLSEFTRPEYVTRARQALAATVDAIRVTPEETAEGLPCYAVAFRGDLQGLFRLLPGKGQKVVTDGGSGGRIRIGKEDQTIALDTGSALQARFEVLFEASGQAGTPHRNSTSGSREGQGRGFRAR